MHNYLKRLILAMTACGLLFAMVTYATGQSALTNQRTLAVTRNLFAAILDRIERLALPPPVVARCSA
jgi:hypothetical protein